MRGPARATREVCGPRSMPGKTSARAGLRVTDFSGGPGRPADRGNTNYIGIKKIHLLVSSSADVIHVVRLCFVKRCAFANPDITFFCVDERNK